MSDEDDDGDDVAIGGAQEPAEASTPLEVAAGGPVTATVQVRKGVRPISETVRNAFKASMEKAKARGDSLEADSLEPVEHEELPAEAAVPVPGEPSAASVVVAETVTPPTVAAAPAPAVTPPPVTPPAPVQPPAPSLDPEVMRMRSDLEQQRQAFEQEKAKWAEQSRTNDIAKLREVYFEKGAPAVGEVIKQWHPGLTDDELKNEVADLIQDLAAQYLGAPIDQATKDRIDGKRTRAGLKTWRQEQDRIAQEREKQLLASQEEQNTLRVRAILHQEVNKPEHKALYPYLVLEDNAGDIIHEVIKREYQESGRTMKWAEAAQSANDWLEKQSRAYYDRRSHLLSPQPPPVQQPAPSDKQRAQGDTQVSRSHAQPKPPVTPAPQPERPVRWSRDAEREALKNKHRASFRNQYADDE